MDANPDKITPPMDFKTIGVRAVTLAATSALGPLTGGVLLAGGAVAFEALATSEWGRAFASMGMHLASDAARELFGCAVDGFRRGRNRDLEKSMHESRESRAGGIASRSPRIRRMVCGLAELSPGEADR